jgi:hypothetical protein
MGVATGASTFFRQIGGTLGVAVLLSVLFAALPTNIVNATADKATLSSALDAALTPAVAEAPGNKAIMKQLWTPIVTPIQTQVQDQLTAATAKAKSAADAAVTQKVTDAVDAQVAAGVIPAEAAPAIIDEQVTAATPAAEAGALAAVANAAHANVDNGTVEVDWANASQRGFYVDKLTPTLVKELKKGDSKANNSSSSATSDTSFLDGADKRLSKPFMVGFNDSVILVYTIGLGVILLAFVLSLFFKVPALRKTSALQERADEAGSTETGSIRAVPVS